MTDRIVTSVVLTKEEHCMERVCPNGEALRGR